MTRTQIKCPNCGQPIVADIQQLFDVASDPAAKQELLLGAFNVARCPHCGFQGNLSTPIVYHDPEEELLLTFIPTELSMPRDEQERMIGGLINQVVENLPQEKRKGYLLQPKQHLTMQSLIERVLETEGITKEMIEEQQQRLNLLQRLMMISDQEARREVIQQEEALVDSNLFSILSRLLEAAAMGGDENSAHNLEELQRDLMETTEFGRQVQEQSAEVQAAINSLQQAGRELTREKLLELVIEAPTPARLSALVSLARQGMDYQFFQLLSERIGGSHGKERERLVELRENLLELTRQVDEQIQARTTAARDLLEQILEAEDITQATEANLPAISEVFVSVLNGELEEARKRGDLERSAKLNQVIEVLQQASALPPEVQLIEEMLEAEDEAARRQLMEENSEAITPEFLQMLSGLIAQVEQSNQDPQLLESLNQLNRQARRFSMESKFKGS